VEAVKFLWKRKHFEERNWKRMQTRMHNCSGLMIDFAYTRLIMQLERT